MAFSNLFNGMVLVAMLYKGIVSEEQQLEALEKKLQMLEQKLLDMESKQQQDENKLIALESKQHTQRTESRKLHRTVNELKEGNLHNMEQMRVNKGMLLNTIEKVDEVSEKLGKVDRKVAEVDSKVDKQRTMYCCEVQGLYGDNAGGSPFSDFSVYNDNGPITAIIVAHGKYVDCLGFVYGTTAGYCHGGKQNEAITVNLNTGEYIWKVTGYHGPPSWGGSAIVTQLSFHTTDSRVLGPFGSYTRGTAYETQSKNYLSYIDGRAGGLVDGLNFNFCEVKQ